MTYDEQLAAFVGRTLVPRKAGQDPVNLAMIRHWCEAMEDHCAVHLDDEAARVTGRPGVVAPASMMQAWTMRGYAATVHPPAERVAADDLWDLLAEGGYTSVVATDSDFEFVRELVPGDHVSAEEVVEDISAEKQTALGAGRFVTTVRTYTDQTGEVVATQRWRTLRFRPKPSAPDRVPRPRPALNHDNRFWFEAAQRKELVIQRCAGCQALRHPPGPACPQCNSFDWDTVTASGEATLYSFVVAHHPRHPAFDYPLVVAVVELSEGTRLITNVVGLTPDQLEIGMPLRLQWLEADPHLTLPVFGPAGPLRHDPED